MLTKSKMAAIQLDVNHTYKTYRARLINDTLFRGFHGRVIQLRCCFNDRRSSWHSGVDVLAKSNMAAIQLDVNHRYKM